MSTLHGVAVQTVQWLGMKFSVPQEWEISRHAVNEENGKLVFIDRRDQRLSLQWTRMTTAPDAVLALSDCRSRDMEHNADAQFADLTRVRSWAGYRWTHNGTTVTRAGYYDRKTSRWLEAVFTRAAGESDQEEILFLEQFRTSSADDVHLRVQAFGMDVSVSAGWKLGGASVLPGDLTLKYCGAAGTLKVRRVKMAHAWNSAGLNTFLTKELGNPKSLVIHPGVYGSHASCTAQTMERTVALRSLLRGRRRQQDTAWHCSETDSVYQISTSIDPGVITGPETVMVRCCRSAGGD